MIHENNEILEKIKQHQESINVLIKEINVKDFEYIEAV